MSRLSRIQEKTPDEAQVNCLKVVVGEGGEDCDCIDALDALATLGPKGYLAHERPLRQDNAYAAHT